LALNAPRRLLGLTARPAIGYAMSRGPELAVEIGVGGRGMGGGEWALSLLGGRTGVDELTKARHG
jgi:hypothetical protein